MNYFTFEHLEDYELWHLDAKDLDRANCLLDEGYKWYQVLEYMRSWNHQIEYEAYCETEDARRFEEWGY